MGDGKMTSLYAEQIGRIEENVETLVGTCGKIEKQLEAANDRQRKDHDKITGLETRLSIWGGAQAGFTTITAILAGWWGSQR